MALSLHDTGTCTRLGMWHFLVYHLPKISGRMQILQNVVNFGCSDPTGCNQDKFFRKKSQVDCLH